MTFTFDFTPTNVEQGMSLKANGTFTVSGDQYTDATGTVYAADASGTFVASNITGIDQLSPDYNPSNIVFSFDADNGQTYIIAGPSDAATLSDADSLVDGTLSISAVGAVPLPPGLPLFGSALLTLALGGFGWRRRLTPGGAEAARGRA